MQSQYENAKFAHVGCWLRMARVLSRPEKSNDDQNARVPSKHLREFRDVLTQDDVTSGSWN